MINNNYQNLAEAILRRNQERLNPNLSLKEQEESQFFYWLMSRMLWRIEGCWPAKENNQIELNAYTVPDGRVKVEHGRISEYWSDCQLKGEEFYNIMEKVSEIINELPNYRTVYFHTENSDTAELHVYITAKKNEKENIQHEKYKLVGILNMFDVFPDFVYPIFEKDDKYYFQSGDDGKLEILEFSQVKDSYVSQIILLNNVENNLISRIESTIKSEPIFAFQKEKGSVVIGNYEQMKDFLSTIETENEILKEQIEDFLSKKLTD